MLARGGDGGNTTTGTVSGGGAGGTIRLLAARVEGAGELSVRPGNGSNANGPPWRGAFGIIRIETFQHAYTFKTDGAAVFPSSPFDTFVTSTSLPTVRVVSVAGVAVSATPTGAFGVPDVTINSDASVPVLVEAKNVPLNAPMKLTIFPEDGPDVTVDVPDRTGAPAQSQATVSVKFPTGFSRGFLRATFTTGAQQP